MDEEGQTSKQQQTLHRRSMPSRLLWRSVLGSPAAWSGSSSRGVYVMDDMENDNHQCKKGNISMIQNIASDRRMFHLPCSLRDAIVVGNNELSHFSNATTTTTTKQPNGAISSCNNPHSAMQLLSHPRIVGAAAAPPRNQRSTFHSGGRAFSGNSGGISCMDLDRGNNDVSNNNNLAGNSPSRYLLVGAGGGDCSITLYDLSYFGSDHCLYQQSSRSNSQYIHSNRHQNNQSSVTHRPIARSLRHANNATAIPLEDNASGIPSGHRQPLLGVNWYPGDVYGAFVSASISGEILVWDARNFVPVFATYAHNYTGAGTNHNDGVSNKSVAPLQCIDLPKTPEGCPHGNALLALGLGADGRGVIQLCDAFRGGSPTHELIGHDGGGVNAVVWDPHRPFRLASGGDDGSVRLWDIRKAGAAACLGALDRDEEMYHTVNNDDDDGGHRTRMIPPRKKVRVGLGRSMSRMQQGIESHGGPVTALAFAPNGEDLVSAGSDGRMHHWDLRPDSCFVSSLSAIDGSNNIGNKRNGGGTMDPSVAIGGRLAPTHFAYKGGTTTGGENDKLASSTSPSRRRRPRTKTSIAIVQPGSRNTATLLSTVVNNNNNGNSSRGQIVGHSLHGRRDKEPGGNPDFVLSGHLADVSCLVPIVGTWDNLKVGGGGGDDGCATTSGVNFLTGGKDGMVLSWGNEKGGLSGGDQMDDRQWQSHSRGGNDRSLNRHSSIQKVPSLEDTDDW
eukprot:CAMPEP_0201661052 /NCGR_PEP_ID=MMETSP0494-20130426/3522_1 /ASSEMBLY_ACC=CAM_ASM_000839 /TAXON_ID=420259 /ORGANISM="Thalassiosira gravida, Strain GMp14c1" /LENGTH=728 /DNA_ID=CAMNT_0048139065 /DNA_START=264 /DNA_END=2450 /DNA_ORIENTATION=+